VFGVRRYVGIELEANQALLATREGRRRTAKSVSESLRVAVRSNQRG
jgi:hypothetical protein